MEALFVDEKVNILRGADAEKAIQARSDARYLTEGQGIVRVPLERWKIAQTFERTGWMEKWRGAGDDRNLLHAEEYNGYRSLAGRTFHHAVELGCGPFTNLRVIGDFAPIENVTLLDPLIESYLQLPKCHYTREALRTHSGGRSMPIAQLHACPIEEMPVTKKFDLIVMMNVIEHCFDVQKIFEKILALAAPGAIFVFHDCIYDASKTQAVLADKYYEAGHPLMVAYPVMEKFMREHFQTLYFSRCPDAPDQLEVCPHTGRFYFMGKVI
ncbi:MAG TPA: class I SAM-dependent methyltransferase [Phycisphaerae bacterium]|nr:class I SAM-dependent methyltransferase [Phycisphaerae bacterium]